MVSVFGRPPVAVKGGYEAVMKSILRQIGISLEDALEYGSDVPVFIMVETLPRMSRSTLAGLAYDAMRETDFLRVSQDQTLDMPEWEDED